jgi:hypothetical protein
MKVVPIFAVTADGGNDVSSGGRGVGDSAGGHCTHDHVEAVGGREGGGGHGSRQLHATGDKRLGQIAQFKKGCHGSFQWKG